MRTGELWGVTRHGLRPDLLVTGKGLSGGLYPIAAVLVADEAAGWLRQDGFAHMSTFGGAELGCLVALKTLEITTRPGTRANVLARAEQIRAGLARIQTGASGWLAGIRQNGLVLGLEFTHPQGARIVMRELYDRGVWAIFSTLDPSVLQYKPGVLMTRELTDELLDRTAQAVSAAARTAGLARVQSA
jgi:acetylornithine/succinyldiaminopimelate/putrescine aminotransferase